MTGPRKVHIKSYGCQMNVYDSHRMADMLSDGYAETARAEDADLIILNTCHIREKAAEKIYSELGRVREIKELAAQDGRRVTVAVAGCVAQAEGEEVFRRAAIVDVVVGPQSYHRLPALLDQAAREGRALDTDFPLADKFQTLPPASRAVTRARGVASFLTIQEGCDKFCTFCVVPYTRGAELSRPAEAIVAEAQRLAGDGVRELTLLGQNVNAYHGKGTDGRDWNLARLLYRLADIPGIARLRYTTSHPCDIGDDLIAAHGELDCLMPHLHLPVQSGSDTMLRVMNRNHTRADYLRGIERLLRARPGMAFTTDFIVGFPGESDADFEASMTLLETVRYSSAFSFKYSPRPGTPAASMQNQVLESVKNERLARLQKRVLELQTAFNHSLIGRTIDVLFEKPGKHDGQITGKSPYLQPVQVTGDRALIGTIAPVRIESLGANSLYGTPANMPHATISQPLAMEA